MAEPSAVNASPLIFLARAGFTDFLQLSAPEIVVPGPVAAEIRRRGLEDPTARVLARTPWLRVIDPSPPPPTVQRWDLGPGESAVLSWCLAHPGSEAIIDDLAARRCVMTLGVPLRGTLGLVLIAKQRGRIPAARPVVEVLMRAGLRLSDRFVNQALARVGE